ncbi:riboflavin synthase [Chryseobacterium sp. A301]
MFTGIIEGLGRVEKIQSNGRNVDFTLSSPFTRELKVDQSVAHDGCCLTVVAIEEDRYVVNAIEETLMKTKLGEWELGSQVNLERCTVLGGRLDGHIVQGHVDQTGTVLGIEDVEGSYLVRIGYDESFGFLTVAQGSITVNGISLTVARSMDSEFSVALIPYTWEFTNMHALKVGQKVNLEFDIIGKYVTKLISRQNAIK